MATVHPSQSIYLPLRSYVLSLVSHPDCFAASASSPSDAIHLLDKSNLHPIASMQGHPGGITGARSVPALPGTNSQALVSCGKDGTVKVWDHRSNQVATKMTSPGDTALLCFDVSSNGHMVAAGTESNAEGASILYWDVRKPTVKTHSHTSTHSDDITVLQFNPSTNKLLSASTDGLLSLSDPSESDEDEAVIQVGNWGASIAQAGWHKDGVWASSDMETFSLWSNDLDKSADFSLRDLNQHLPPQTQMPWQPDYLIGCHPSSNSLLLFVGSNSGSFSIVSLPSVSTQGGTVDRIYPPHHEGIVRAVLWDEHTGGLLTGGEDSKVNLWDDPLSYGTVPSNPIRKRELHDEDMDVDEQQGYKKVRRD